MKKVDELYKLMLDYKQILEISESKKDLKLLNNFIDLLKNYKDVSYNEFVKKLSSISKFKNNITYTKVKTKNTKYDISKVVLAYKNSIKNNTKLSKSESELLENFNSKYPNIKNIVSLNISELYKTIHSISLKNFTVIELQFLLKFYFNTKTSSRNTKQELYDRLLNDIYQNNYLDSLNAGYSNVSNDLK